LDGKRRAKVAYLALIFVILVSILVRYPRFPHEFAGDTLELHYYSDALRNDGTATWVMSPLSWFGLYPVSYSMGVPILGAQVGELAGIPSEDALALCGVMIGILSVLGFAMIAYRLTGNIGVALVAGAAIATSGFNGPQTIAGLSGRPVIQALFPFALWALVPAKGSPFWPSGPGPVPRVIVLILTNLAMAAAHRLFLLAIMAEVAIYVGIRVYRWLSLIPAIESRGMRALRVPSWVLAGAILAWGAYTLEPGVRAGPTFLSSLLVSQNQPLFVAGYLLEFAWNVGALVMFLGFGAYAWMTGTGRWSPAHAALLVTFAGLLFLVVPSFSAVALAPLPAVLAGEGWMRVARARRTGSSLVRIAATLTLAVGVLLVAAVQGYYVLETQDAHRNADGTSFFVDTESIESGLYLRGQTGAKTFMTPDLGDSRRVASAGHVATISSETMILEALPYVKANLTIVYGLGDLRNPLDINYYIRVGESLVESKTLYSARDWIIPGGGYGFGNHWGQVATLESSAPAILTAYDIHQVLLNNVHSSGPLTQLTRANYYVEYSNSLESIYQIQVSATCLHGMRGCP
jgi:hypothetical protein